MGNEASSLPTDPRIERCMKIYEIPAQAIKVLLEIYKRFDSSKKGRMFMMEEFFINLLEVPRSPLTDAIPGFMATDSNVFLTFGEFVDIVCTFATTERLELTKFAWYILDARQVGTVTVYDTKRFFHRIWRHRPYAPIPQALVYLNTVDDNGTFTYRELEQLHVRYPFLFSPVYQLWQHMRSRTLGEQWWSVHKIQRANAKQHQHERDDQLTQRLQVNREHQDALDSIRTAVVRQKMGVRTHRSPWAVPTTRKRLMRIAAVEAELEHQFLRIQEGIR